MQPPLKSELPHLSQLLRPEPPEVLDPRVSYVPSTGMTYLMSEIRERSLCIDGLLSFARSLRATYLKHNEFHVEISLEHRVVPLKRGTREIQPFPTQATRMNLARNPS